MTSYSTVLTMSVNADSPQRMKVGWYVSLSSTKQSKHGLNDEAVCDVPAELPGVSRTRLGLRLGKLSKWICADSMTDQHLTARTALLTSYHPIIPAKPCLQMARHLRYVLEMITAAVLKQSADFVALCPSGKFHDVDRP